MPELPRHNWLATRFNLRAVTAYAPYAHGRLLDVGCGTKPYEELLRPFVVDYIGLEHESTAHSRDRVDVWGEATDLPFTDNEFGTLTMFHVLEHTEEPLIALQEAFRVLEPGGVLMMAVPFMWGVHEAPRDYFRFTPYGLTHLLRSAGFRQVVVDPLCGMWAVIALRISYALKRLETGPFVYPVRLLYAALQWPAVVLDRADRIDGDAGGYYVLARRPAST